MKIISKLGKYLLLLLLTISFENVFSQGLQKITIAGSVTDSSGKKLQGASIIAENQKNVSTTTDADGKFVLEVTPGTVLVISYVGFKELKVTVAESKRIMDIVLQYGSTATDEVVIVAYGKKQRKEAVVGSVTSIEPGELKIPASNLTNAMAGQIAGVIAYQRNGQPGQDNASFFIRGVTTFGYKQDPLILIDNVELSANDLARLQVDDIATFSILKDASATALYGARGANGVILVTTKEGKVGKAKVNLRIENAVSQSAKTLELADPITYMKLFNEATVTRDPLQPLPFSQNKIINSEATYNHAPGSNPYVYPVVDWQKLLFKNSTNTERANLSVSGGGGVARYYVAGSYNLDKGILREDAMNNTKNNVKFQNYQIRSNININVTKTTELVVRLTGNFSEYAGPLAADGSLSTDLYNYAVHTSPVLFPAFFPADSANLNTKHILFGNIGSNNSITYNNPYAALLRGHKNFSESRMSAQVELNQDLSLLTKGLSFKGIFSTNRYSYFDFSMAYSPFYYNIGTYDRTSNQYTLSWLNPNATGYNVATEYLNYSPGNTSLNTFIYLQGVLDYNRKFGVHNISSTVIATRQQTLYANAPNLLQSLPYRNLGLAGRATYSYNNRYYVEVNFGYNGSERFSENHRYGFFPTIGASWVVSNEKFWGGISKTINRLKIRASHGLVGNDAIGSQRFFYQSDVNLNGGGNYAVFGTNNQYGRNGVYINSYANPNITWETSRQTNLGVEMTLFKNLNIVAEFYKQFRYDILQTRSSVPTTMGLETVVPLSANIGTAYSKGIDLHVDYKQTFNKNLWVSVLGNITITESKYGKYEEPQWAEPYRYLSGQAINMRWGYIAERLFVDDKEAANSPKQVFSTNGRLPKGGDIKYRDLNGDGKIDGADQTFIGLPTTPRVVYGFGFSSGYKNFDLSAFFQGVAKVSLFIDPSRTSPFLPSPDAYIGGNTQLIKEFADSHWSEENQDLYAIYPRLGSTTNEIENNLQSSTWWLRNGDFMRLKSLEIGYTLPSALAKRLHLSSSRLYFNGLNLITWSSFKTWDPELGGNAFTYPIQKVFNVGLSINL
jgi:TonB-linked SusC/RagA family outer membrane protein